LSSLEQGQATLIAMFEKSIGKKKEGAVVVIEGTSETERSRGQRDLARTVTTTTR
jgi:hypothetical protein